MWWNRSRPTAQPTNDTNIPEDGDAENVKMPLGRQETICGLRRKVFFFVILGGIFIAVAAIAIGVGAGIAFNKGSSKSEETIVDTSSDISCPDSHDTVVKSGDHYFRISCDIDYPVSSGAVDLDTKDAPAIGRCVELCSDEKGCMGVSWEDGECVLKESVGRSRKEKGMVLALGVDKPDGAD